MTSDLNTRNGGGTVDCGEFTCESFMARLPSWRSVAVFLFIVLAASAGLITWS